MAWESKSGCEFQLTRSRGAWLMAAEWLNSTQQFQLTRSRGAWLSTHFNSSHRSYFNSHAHVERDLANHEACITCDYISTHTLTWSVTPVQIPIELNEVISTHTLTWSVTLMFCVFYYCTIHFNSHAHVERDHIHIYIQTYTRHFNSHAHVERDVKYYKVSWACMISTHTLTWSVTL